MRILLCLLLSFSSLAWAKAERVVSLAPSLTEVMFDLGAESSLVGILEGGKRPAAAAHIPSIGSHGQLNLELLLTLKPDLVLYWPGSIQNSQKQAIEQLGIRVFDASTNDLASYTLLFQRLGDELGYSQQGAELTAQAQQRIAQMRQTYQREVPIRVFYQIWDKPMFTLGGQQIISEILQVCGAQNIFSDIAMAAPQVDREAVMLRNPDVILTSTEALVETWKPWTTINAVRQQQVISVLDHGVERPSYQMLDAMQMLCEQLKPMQVIPSSKATAN
ncbi:helical backbone metal receptor [Pseudomonas sp. F1_0610]|uniref:helical backbone metal receptor n=1 Tax=Pseudomonas sp. F1_0610 TaxID=3114284 RepID=UPI0039C3A92E